MNIELNRREMELQVAESALHVEASRLAAWAEELAARQAKSKNGGSPVSVPANAVKKLEEKSRDARSDALRTREKVNSELRSMLENAASALQRMEENLKLRLEEETVRPASPPGLRLATPAKKSNAKDMGLAAHLMSSMPDRNSPLAESLLSAADQEQDEPIAAPAASVLVIAPTPGPQPLPAAPVVRLNQRVKMNAQVDLSSESNFYRGFSSNISEGGIFVTTVKLAPLGTEIDLAFTLPSGEHIECRGVVRWLREASEVMPDMLDGMGLQFLDLADEARAAIEDFVSQRDPLFFAA